MPELSPPVSELPAKLVSERIRKPKAPAPSASTSPGRELTAEAAERELAALEEEMMRS